MFTEPKIVAKDHAPVFIVWFTTTIAGDTPHMAINSDKISTYRNVRSTTKMFQRRYCWMSFAYNKLSRHCFNFIFVFL